MPAVNRRTVLFAPIAAAGAQALAACTDGASPTPPADPDRMALSTALTLELGLLAQVDQWKRRPAAGLASADVRQLLAVHIDRLRQTLGTATAPSPAPTSAPLPVTTVGLAQAADRVADSHTRSMVEAGVNAAQLLASLAASDAALAGQLRSVA